MTPDERKATQMLYAEQRAAIADTIDEFLAPFEIVRLRDGQELSYAPCPAGAAVLLPKTDLVGFTGLIGGRRWSMLVWWEAASALAPPVLAVDACFTPARYRVVRFPSPRELKSLEAASVIGASPATTPR